MSKSFLLLSFVVLITQSCGVDPSSSASDAEQTCPTSACIKLSPLKPKFAVESAQPDTGPTAPSQPNLAEKLWNLQSSGESLPTSLLSSFGKAAPAWVQAATLAAGSQQAVTHGTITQQSNGAFAYSTTPTDKLVVNPSSGAPFALEVVATSGDFLSATFPSCTSCSFSATWVSSSASLAMKLDSAGKARWRGWVLAEDNLTHITVDLSSTDVVFVSTVSLYTSDKGDVSGTIQLGDESLALHYADFVTDDGSVQTITYTDDATITVSEGTFVLSNQRGTSTQNGRQMLTWQGTILQNNVEVGHLEPHIEAQSNGGDVVDRLVHVNSDVFNVGQLFVAGIASPSP